MQRLGTASQAAALLRGLAALVLATLITGCAVSLPPHADQAMSKTSVAPAGTPLAEVAARAGIEAGATAAWPMPESAFALDARLAAIAGATTSVDLQTYLVADDATGRQILRALRDAAMRGVRVRLLVDDIYTAGLDPLLMGLASEPNAEVRLFNPFANGRTSSFGRLLALLGDFHRLDHRMHNKLFVADGAIAIVGGRNVADEYFLRGARGNFFDVDLLFVGALVRELSAGFDSYWNSDHVYDVRTITAAAKSVSGEAAELREAFERRTVPVPPPMSMATPPLDQFGAPPFSAQLASGRFRLLPVSAATTLADPPAKANLGRAPQEIETVARRFLSRLDEASGEVIVFSPYFVPDERARAKLREVRGRGVEVRIVTNSLAVSDEPLTLIGLERHQRELLMAGVDLYELSSEQAKLDSYLRSLLGSSIGRLHAKLALVDRRLVYVGSLNLDPRSAHINTELGVRIESPEIAAMLFSAFRIEEAAGVVRVRLAPDGKTLSWSVLDANGEERTLDHEPDGSWWHRFRLRVLGALVPEGEL
jgi:phosphatidylserine/phosphatidylglycerophosphate/cardiolipin synthase-like enzyme